jgi:hypothetical protein
MDSLLAFLANPSSHALTLAVGYLLCHFTNVVPARKELAEFSEIARRALQEDHEDRKKTP